MLLLPCLPALRRAPLRRAAPLAAAATVLAVLLSACAGGGGTAAPPSASGVLTIAMTAADIPNMDTVLASQQGYEGYRFVGNSLYDGLTKWNLKQGTSTPRIEPGLAKSWTISPDHLTWTFHLRPGVKFTDGTPFNADAVIYNLDRYFNPKSPQYDAAVAGTAAQDAVDWAGYKKVDDMTVSITTKVPDSHLDSDIVFLYMASPTALKKYGSSFDLHPVGTGPFELEKYVRGQEADFVPNPDYWAGPSKLKELVLKPIPDAAARTAALRSGTVNWIEAPTPDDIPDLQSAGFKLYTNSYDHIWPWLLNTQAGPLANQKVRLALEYAIDRKTMSTDLLKGTANPAYQLAPVANGAYRPSANVFSYDPAKAKELLKEAGYPNGFSMSVSYPTSGSGNMEPGPMNEELQSDLAKIGVKVKLEPIEWSAMLSSVLTGKIPGNADALNISLTFIEESSWSEWFSSSSPLDSITHFKSPAVDKLLAQAQSQFDYAKRMDIYAKAVKLIDEQAPWLVVVNDRNPRMLAPSVHGFIQPKSWFVDLTTITVS